ncbi:MAG: TetR/AcrR family transcriptional regulator [Eubacteriales bacterium]|nr:TetR/AcrR family transcriptional regulator [Eubacteriales bacterium]
MEFKEDLRIQKTRRDLRKVILELLKQNPLEKISVKEICDRAMVNRITFYKYYEDKYLLLDDALNEIKDTLLNSVSRNEKFTSIDEASTYLVNVLEMVVKYIEDNIDFVYALEQNSSMKLINIITFVCESGINDLLTEINKIKPLKYSIPVTASFIYGGFVSALTYLIHHKNTNYKAELNMLIDDLKSNIFKIEFLYK